MQVQLSSDLKKLEALYSNHKRNLHSLERRIEWLSSADERADKAVQRWTKEIDRRNAAATPDFKFVAGGRTYGSDDKPALVNRFASVMKEAHQMKTASPWEAPRLVDVGEYRGFKVVWQVAFQSVLSACFSWPKPVHGINPRTVRTPSALWHKVPVLEDFYETLNPGGGSTHDFIGQIFFACL